MQSNINSKIWMLCVDIWAFASLSANLIDNAIFAALRAELSIPNRGAFPGEINGYCRVQTNMLMPRKLTHACIEIIAIVCSKCLKLKQQAVRKATVQTNLISNRERPRKLNTRNGFARIATRPILQFRGPTSSRPPFGQVAKN